jgi:hypothetical protein
MLWDLSERERAVLDALIEHGYVKRACDHLGMRPGGLHTAIARIKAKARAAQGPRHIYAIVVAYDRWKREHVEVETA